MAMKICELCAVDFTLYHFLLPLMQRLRAAGHDVVGACSDGPYLDRVIDAGFRVETIPIARSYNLVSHVRSFRRLRNLFRRERFDMVHVHTPVAALIGRFAAHAAGVPRIVYTAHGFYFHERMPWPKRALFVALEWLAGRVTDVLMTQAAEDAATARRLGFCKGGVVEAIGNGVDPARFYPRNDAGERAALRQSFGVAKDITVIVVIGRLVTEKGYPELLAAMREVDAELWIVGERLVSDHAGPVDAALADIESDPAISRRVRLLGYRTDVAELLRAADIFVLPSHREGMPRSIIEAMMSGLPVVAPDIRGAREEVVPEETGILVPVNDPYALADALNRLVSDPALRDRMGSAGRKRALELFDESKIVDRQFEILGLGGVTA